MDENEYLNGYETWKNYFSGNDDALKEICKTYLNTIYGNKITNNNEKKN